MAPEGGCWGGDSLIGQEGGRPLSPFVTPRFQKSGNDWILSLKRGVDVELG